jgi:hypothetical protein
MMLLGDGSVAGAADYTATSKIVRSRLAKVKTQDVPISVAGASKASELSSHAHRCDQRSRVKKELESGSRRA